MSFALRNALPEELERCCEIIGMGRAFQRRQGFLQWTEEYPDREDLREDIGLGRGYVLTLDGDIAGYLCLDFGGEPAYGAIRGRWGTGEPYGVIHRMAFHSAFQGRGLADAAFQLAEARCLRESVHSLRADTDPANQRMRHILEKNGYTRRGVISYQGSDRLAFDKRLPGWKLFDQAYSRKGLRGPGGGASLGAGGNEYKKRSKEESGDREAFKCFRGLQRLSRSDTVSGIETVLPASRSAPCFPSSIKQS